MASSATDSSAAAAASADSSLWDIRLCLSPLDMAKKAAKFTAAAIEAAIAAKGEARVIFATGASQFDFLSELVKLPVAWEKVVAFHLDEYVGLPTSHPASFRKYLKDRLFDVVKPPMKEVNLLDADNDKALEEYATKLAAGDIDFACIGIGENGHIAFNDPPVADFDDPKLVKVVKLDDKCIAQQIGEGWFPSTKEAPTHAATLTCPAIMRCKIVSVVVPDARKAQAARDAVLGPRSTACPASVLRDHEAAVLWVDLDSSSLLRAPTKAT